MESAGWWLGCARQEGHRRPVCPQRPAHLRPPCPHLRVPESLARKEIDVSSSVRERALLDIVVVTYNSAHVIEALLDSIPGALGDVVANVIVVDNGSADN